MATFGDLIAQLTLRAPGVAPLLLREWLFNAYSDACTGRRFGYLRVSRQYQTRALRQVTGLTLTAGSATVTTSGATFLSTDVGLSLRVGSQGPVSTILAVASATSATLDQPWALSTVPSGTGAIVEAYFTPPADFQQFITVTNVSQLQPMPWWIPQEKLDFFDPKRMWSNAFARLLSPAGLSPVAATSGLPRYEWWPRPTAAMPYAFTYYASPGTPTEDTTLPGPWALRGQILVDGAMREVCRHPGSAERPNPYFNLALADRYDKGFEKGLQDLQILDDDQLPSQFIEPIDWRWVFNNLPFDSHMLRATDADASAYWGGGNTY